MLRRLLSSISLSILFLLVYGTTNYLSSLRHNIPSLYLPVERHIPFLPIFVLPYLSLDLFFVAAPFLTRHALELRVFCARMITAIVAAGLFFIMLPLKFGFQRPPATGAGITANLFNWFRTLDQPYNEFPSLHVMLAIIVFATYWRHSPRLLRPLLVLWFTLILLSPIFTSQHHLIDIAGGTILGVLCLHLIRQEPLRQPFMPNRAVGRLYAMATIAAGTLSFVFVPYTLVLLWPALSLGLVAAGYLFLGPGIYRKHHGRLAITTWILLGPVLLGQWASLIYYRRKCRAFDRLTPDILIGRRLSDREARELSSHGISAVLDLTAEFTEVRPLRDAVYLQLPILDLTAPAPEQLKQALAFIEFHTRAPVMSGPPGMPRRSVYVHCKVGYSRTAAVLGAYLHSTGMDAQQVLAKLREARPGIIIRPEVLPIIQHAITTKHEIGNM